MEIEKDMVKEEQCPRCKKISTDVHYIWDILIDGKRDIFSIICKDCNEELDSWG